MGVLVSHTTFVVERNMPGSPRHTFRFWSDFELKRRWSACHPSWTVLRDELDFRIGGGETTHWRTPDGVEHRFEAHYLDILPSERIIYSYTMSTAGRQLSASLATVEFTAAGPATRMTFTEQAAFADAAAGVIRQNGTGIGFDRLVAVVEQDLAVVH